MLSRLFTIISCVALLSFSNSIAQPPLKKPLNHKMEKSSEKEHKTENKGGHGSEAEESHAHTVSLDELVKGNENFQNNLRKNQNFDEQRKVLSKGQKPNYIVVTCSDSRVCPEILFDSGLGEVFVVRTAGNVVDSVGLGSIEYAAEHLKSQYVIVMGHTACGAVTAAMEGETPSPYINSIIKYIQPAVKTAKSKKESKPKMLLTAIDENVKNQIKMIKKSEIIKELVEAGHLTIVGCVYDLETGETKFMK